MKNVKQFAIEGLQDLARYHRTDPDYQMMKRGYENIRDHSELFALVDL